MVSVLTSSVLFIVFIYILQKGVLDTTFCDKVCKQLAALQWFSLGTPVSSTNKTDFHTITEILNEMSH
jgi:hypothetical protein